jgi:tetratricopeptide (TPR) repeat protein
MKNKLILLAAISCTMVGFSQKNELKSADKALKSGSVAEAKAALESASSLIANADDKQKAQYYFLKGETYSKLAKEGDASAFNTAIESYNSVLSTEEASGKAKYTVETKQKLSAMTADLVNSAVEDNSNKKYKVAAEKLYLGYTLSPKDTVYLYYAASSAVNGGEYEQALTYYNELKDLGYDGAETKYTAVNISTGETEEMSKSQRDLMLKSKTYKDPAEVVTPSKKSEIVKNIALIYTQLGHDDKALEAYKDARANDPEDVNLILNEANLYFKLGDKEKFKSLMSEATALQPDNADLFYNIGVVSMEQGNIEEARKAYNRTLELNPGYVNAQLNLSTTYVNEGNELIDEMNSLGNSRADIAKYDELKEKKDSLFRRGADILEESLKVNPDNQGILEQLKNIYGALGDNENFMRLKKLIEG